MSRSICSHRLKLALLFALAVQACNCPPPDASPKPTATQIPVATPSLAATPYSREQTACDHSYLPLRFGARWRYRLSVPRCEGRCTDMDETDIETSWQVTDVRGDEHLAEATILVQVADVSILTLYALCDDAGIRFLENSDLEDCEYYLDDEYYWYHPCECTYDLVHYDYSTARCSGPTAGGLATCSHWSFLPSADSLIPGHVWKSGTAHGGSAGILYPSSEYTVIAVEPVVAVDQEYNGLTLARNDSCSSVLPCYNCGAYYLDYVETESVLTGTIQMAFGIGITQVTTHISHTHISNAGGSLHANITWTLELLEYDIPQ